jgi:hypothetical protein
MTDFRFKAPTFFDPDATAEESDTVYEDAPRAGEALAKIKRFALWLHAELVKKGLSADGPTHDEGGWFMSVPAKKGFALIGISIEKGEPFDVSTMEIGSAAAEHSRVEQAIEEILRNSDAVSELSVMR